MPSVSLPDDASLEQLRKQAKDVRDLARAGVPGALDLVAEYHPRGAHAVTLTGAQLVVARHNGFASWARLKQHLEMIERYRRSPDEVDQTSGAADEFLAFACLRFGGDDEPARWERAARVLAAHPELTRSSIYVAAAAGDEASVLAQVAADLALASREGGPYGWEPLLYLASARPVARPVPAVHGGDLRAGQPRRGRAPARVRARRAAADRGRRRERRAVAV